MKNFQEFMVFAKNSIQAEQWSGSIRGRYGSVPAVSTDASIRSGVDKALSKPGISHSASEIKGKTGLTGGANISYSANLGNSSQASKIKVNDEKPSSNTTVRRYSSNREVVLKKPDKDPDKQDIKIVKDGGSVNKKKFDDSDKPAVRPGAGPAGQQLRGAIASIRDITGENKREAEHQNALGPTHVKGRLQSGAQRLGGVLDAIRTATDSARQMRAKN